MVLRRLFCFSVSAAAVGLLALQLAGSGRAGERRAPSPPVEIEDPRGGADPRPIVAVIDTGVDTEHPALKGRCLPGINLAEPGEPAADTAGHGTAIAGLIAAVDADPEFCGVNPDVRILPIKVTAGNSRESLPALLAMAVDRALEEQASVLCIAMGAPRSSKTLDEALERARAAGVLVVAAAGVSDGSADLWPAAHPWAVSCTVTEPGEVEMPDGARRMVEFPAARAHISGKTEIVGKGFAKVIAAGGGKGQIEGSSVPCARAAGYAALLRRHRPEMSAAEIRRALVLSGPALEIPNMFRAWPARQLDREALLAYARDARPRDLVLLDQDANPAPTEPGKPSKLELEILNIGATPQGGEVSVEFPGEKLVLKGKFEAIPAGGSRKTTLDLPAMEEGRHKGIVRLTAGSDGNAGNDLLNIALDVIPAVDCPVLVSRPAFTRLRVGETSLVIEAQYQNAGATDIAGQAVAALGDHVVTKEVTLRAREVTRLSFELNMPDLPKGTSGIRPGIGFRQGDKTISLCELDCTISSDAARTQYADAWATKEIIIDAPAAVMEGRTTVPVLLFAPEVHTLIDHDRLGSRRGFPDIADRARGIWLYDVQLEELDAETARTTEISPWAPTPETRGGRTLLRVQGEVHRPRKLPEQTRLASDGILIESAVGMPIDPLDLIGFVEEDGWHGVINLPIAALQHNSEPFVYIRALVRCLDQARNPWFAGWGGFDSRSVNSETVLRVRLHTYLPKLDAAGQYYDIHVHTMCEFSRDAVEPRLSFGGPLWMLVRSAHAMGFVDDDYVRAVRSGALSAIAAREVLFTTDHNCFLTDADTPFALPFRTGEAEITTLRRFVGRGASQELALADRGGRPLGAAHALGYGREPIPGPWHGGRHWSNGLGKASSVLMTIRAWGLEKGLGAVLPAILKVIADTPSLQAPALEKVNEAIAKLGLPPAEMEGFLEVCRTWGRFTPEHVQELLDQAERVVSGATSRGETNDLTVEKIEREFAAHGCVIAAHPMAGSSLHWNLDDLDRAANLAGGPFVEAQLAGRFPFAGVQIWNEEPMFKLPLDHPDQLRQVNVWLAGKMRRDDQWHREWMTGFVHYLNRLVRPGLMYTFDRDQPRSRFFIRKLYHYAGSDAHGSFNFTTGVGATVLTHTDLMPLLAMFGHGHGTSTHSSHFGCARVYAQKPSFEEVYRGRVVCTDGPLVWAEVDSDLKFDAAACVWHESWDVADRAQDVDGQIGGEGTFDGGRTALVRRNCDKLVLRYRTAEGGPRAPAVRRLDLYRVNLADDPSPREADPMGQFFRPKSQDAWAPGAGTGMQYRALTPWAPSGPAILMLGGFSAWDEEHDLRFDVNTRRCFTNPIWLTTVEIGASARPVAEGGKAVVPPGEFVATFRCDHSMLDEGTTVLLKQFNGAGDSTAGTWTLVPAASPEQGFWRPEAREAGGRPTEVDDCVLVAKNLEPIPLGQPWYPKPGVNTFAVILVNPKDMHGNTLNAVAAKIEVAVPPGFVVEPDSTAVPDPGEAARKTATPEGAVVCVRPGDTVTLPKGAVSGDRNIPAGRWTPGAIPAAGTPLTITSGGHSVSVLVIESTQASEPALDPQGANWVGVAPTPGGLADGAAVVLLKNHAERTLEYPEVLVQTPGAVVYQAPEAEPGPCTVTVRQGSAEKTVSVEAVKPKLVWDAADAAIGDVRELRIEMLGASDPAAWVVSGFVTVQAAQVTQTAPALRPNGDGYEIAGFRGDSSFLLRARATQAGEMTAKGTLRAKRRR